MQFITLLARCQLCYIALPAVKMCDNNRKHRSLQCEIQIQRVTAIHLAKVHQTPYFEKIICINPKTFGISDLLSPHVHFARWAHMRRFLSVCLSVRPSVTLDNNSYL